MPKIDLDAVAPQAGSDYPSPHEIMVAGRRVRRLSDAAGITDFVVNHVVLPAGALSSQRHWHVGEDEFLTMIAGSAVLVDDGGETPVTAGDCLSFPKADGNGHHLRAGSGGCTFVVMGLPEASPVHYPDIDMVWDDKTDSYTHRDGTPYPASSGSDS